MDDEIIKLLSRSDYNSIQRGSYLLRFAEIEGVDTDLIALLGENITSNSKAAILKKLLWECNPIHLVGHIGTLTTSIIQLLESAIVPLDLSELDSDESKFHGIMPDVDEYAYLKHTDEVDSCVNKYLHILVQYSGRVQDLIFEYFMCYDGPLYADVANFASYCSSNEEIVHLFLKKARVSKVIGCQQYCLDQVFFSLANPVGGAISGALESSLDEFFLDRTIDPAVRRFLLGRFCGCPYPRVGSYLRRLRDKRYGVGLWVLIFVELRSRLHTIRCSIA